MARLFGTDGVRGVANTELSAELAYMLGRVGAYALAGETHHTPRILVGKDTRISGDMLEAALCAGICSTGAEAVLLGIIPTPAVAYLTRLYKADAGVVISASHNPFEFNGIKFFNSSGFKLADEIEDRIEALVKTGEDYTQNGDAFSKSTTIASQDNGFSIPRPVASQDNGFSIPRPVASQDNGFSIQRPVASQDNGFSIPRPVASRVGRITKMESALEDYVSYIYSKAQCRLDGITIAMDCANGAAYMAAPMLFERLGAKIHIINNTPDGTNINQDCGSTHLYSLSAFAGKCNADIGIAFDGDADRVLAISDTGEVIDGDRIMAITGLELRKKGKLTGNTIVATVMSNLGLDIMARTHDINIIKAKVGDRYVLEEMINGGYVLGGEQSGHVIFLEHNTTGDGILTAMKLLEAMKLNGRKLSQLAEVMQVLPQVLKNARVSNTKKHNYLDDYEISLMCNTLEKEFHGEGRVLVRPSGTEPLVRVMIEGLDIDYITKRACELVELIEIRLGE